MRPRLTKPIQNLTGVALVLALSLACGGEPCVFYLRSSRPFDVHLHPMPQAQR